MRVGRVADERGRTTWSGLKEWWEEKKEKNGRRKASSAEGGQVCDGKEGRHRRSERVPTVLNARWSNKVASTMLGGKRRECRGTSRKSEKEEARKATSPDVRPSLDRSNRRCSWRKGWRNDVDGSQGKL